jgi:hypothetical protein
MIKSIILNYHHMKHFLINLKIKIKPMKKLMSVLMLGRITA